MTGHMLQRLKHIPDLLFTVHCWQRGFRYLLPGNPVSCLCAYDFFAGPAIRKMGGRNADWTYRKQSLPLNRKIASAVGRVDYEGEIAVRISTRARHVSEAEAWSVIDGILPLNDVTARDLQAKDYQWSRAKGFDTF
ncbi:MAG: hypothetical protein DSY94_08025 [SAR324 cluster bacterium]|uniref:Fumarylacetoacetase-like C-terminal domain-containing protein n=1 Tax=SAR324 cluster bacterium TaxID=2024889 RepID=A0A432GID4_9DELT|nr:MAG: hypothetical protein DSY94_08025 [SAR324 cluster bacterium]